MSNRQTVTLEALPLVCWLRDRSEDGEIPDAIYDRLIEIIRWNERDGLLYTSKLT